MTIQKKQMPRGNRPPNHKMKPFYVLQYLMDKSDEDNAIKVDGTSKGTILEYLDKIGISADRRSVYRDIKEINKAMLVYKEGITIEEAEERIEEEGDECCYIVYDRKEKGYYLKRDFTFNEVRFAAESIYSSKFMTSRMSKELIDKICMFVSEEQRKQIKHNVHLVDRDRTDADAIFANVEKINLAMSRKKDGKKREPTKIKFKYQKHFIREDRNTVEKRDATEHTVSPYALLIRDGYYYLLAFDDKYQEIRTFRVDRMNRVIVTGVPREGEDAFAEVDLTTYDKRIFSMYREGKSAEVTMRFNKSYLSTLIDRFETRGISYRKFDEDQFDVTVEIDVSKMFYAWLCGFGDGGKLISPEWVVKDFKKYLKSIEKQY